MELKAEPVESDRYNDEWISCAWGEDNLEELLQKGDLILRPRVQRALDLCNIKPGMSMLDIACGRGEVPAFVAEKGLFSVGIDYSFSVLGMANQVRRKRTANYDGQLDLKILQSDACSLPFQSNSFDRISMLDIVEHLTSQQLEFMFAEVKRLLKPDGYAVVHTLPNRWVYDIGYKWFHFINKKLPVQPRSEIEQQVHINEQDIIGLSNLLDHCGLNHQLWLEQLIPAQARWQSSKRQLSDNRATMYPMLAGWLGRLLELLSQTPLKLILSNDIFAILWEDEQPDIKIKRPFSFTERLVCWFGRKH